MEHDRRPWGEYWVLEDAETHKVKRIQVKPGGRLSLQYHFKRAEVWTIVSGIGTITINDSISDFEVGEAHKFHREHITVLKTEPLSRLFLSRYSMGTVLGNMI